MWGILAGRLNAYYGNHATAGAVRAELVKLPVDAATMDALMSKIRAPADD